MRADGTKILRRGGDGAENVLSGVFDIAKVDCLEAHSKG